MTSFDAHTTNRDLAKKASQMIEITQTGLFGIYGWNVKDRVITSEGIKGYKIKRTWYLNGVRINYRLAQLLTYKLLGLI